MEQKDTINWWPGIACAVFTVVAAGINIPQEKMRKDRLFASAVERITSLNEGRYCQGRVASYQKPVHIETIVAETSQNKVLQVLVHAPNNHEVRTDINIGGDALPAKTDIKMSAKNMPEAVKSEVYYIIDKLLANKFEVDNCYAIPTPL